MTRTTIECLGNKLFSTLEKGLLKYRVSARPPGLLLPTSPVTPYIYAYAYAYA